MNLDKKLTAQEMGIIGALSVGAMIGAMNSAIFNVAIPTMMTVFQTSVTEVQWLISGYLLATGIITPAVGALGDRYGYTKVYLLTNVLVIVLAVAGAFAWCIEVLIGVRILMGFAAGIMMPLTMAMLYQYLPPKRQMTAVSVWSMVMMIGGVLPACLAGIIIQYFSWRGLLLVNIPLALVALVLTIKYLPRMQPQAVSKLDTTGLCLTALGSVSVLLAFSNVAAWGWQSAKFWVLLVSGVLMLAFYVVKISKREGALLNLSVLKYPRYVAAFCIDAILIVALYMVTFVTPVFLQNALGFSPLETGMIVLPGSICIVLIMPVAGWLYNRLGARGLALIGIVTITVATVPFITLTMLTPVWIIVAAMSVRGLGMGCMNLMVTNAEMSVIPQELSGHGSALTNWMRQVVGALVTSISSGYISSGLNNLVAPSAADTAQVYVSASNHLYFFSTVAMICCLPIALKYLGKGAKQEKL